MDELLNQPPAGVTIETGPDGIEVEYRYLTAFMRRAQVVMAWVALPVALVGLIFGGKVGMALAGQIFDAQVWLVLTRIVLVPLLALACGALAGLVVAVLFTVPVSLLEVFVFRARQRIVIRPHEVLLGPRVVPVCDIKAVYRGHSPTLHLVDWQRLPIAPSAAPQTREWLGNLLHAAIEG